MKTPKKELPTHIRYEGAVYIRADYLESEMKKQMKS